MKLKKIRKDPALKLMSAYAKEHPDEGMSARGVKNYIKRNELVALIMTGIPVEDAFAQF